MLKKVLFTVFSLCVIGLSAQVPSRMSYQSIIRDSTDKLLSNAEIGIRINIIQDNNAVYSEHHDVRTNANGLVSLVIGDGIDQLNDIEDVDWSQGSTFIQTFIDPSGGQDYSIFSTNELLSVPYALHAKTADSGGGGSSGSSNIWSQQGNSIYYDNGNVGINTRNPNSKLSIVGGDNDGSGNNISEVMRLSNNNYTRLRMTTYSDRFFRNAQIRGVRARGSETNPTGVEPGDRVFGSYAYVFDRSNQFLDNPVSSIEHFVGSAVPSGQIVFYTFEPNTDKREERLRIFENGNIGVNQSTPRSKLHVSDGDVYIDDINSGVIMKSPNGSCWRMQVSNAGEPTFSQVSCP